MSDRYLAYPPPMKMFFSYLLYAHIRLQIQFGAYTTGRMFLSSDVLNPWMLVKAHVMLGLLRFFWFYSVAAIIAKLTNNPHFAQGPIFLIVCFGALIITFPFTTEKALNYEFHKKMFEAWSDSKRMRWDIYMILSYLASFATTVYLCYILNAH